MGGRPPSLKEVIEDPSISTPYTICRIAFDSKFVELCCIKSSNISELILLREQIESRLKGNKEAEAAVSKVAVAPSLENWREISRYLSFEMAKDNQYKNDLIAETHKTLHAIVDDSLDLLEYIMLVEEEEEEE